MTTTLNLLPNTGVGVLNPSINVCIGLLTIYLIYGYHLPILCEIHDYFSLKSFFKNMFF